jgi:hypothetical protein
LSILGREPSSMRSTTQIAPNPKESPITPSGMPVFCATQSATKRPKAMAVTITPTGLAGWEIAAHDEVAQPS